MSMQKSPAFAAVAVYLLAFVGCSSSSSHDQSISVSVAPSPAYVGSAQTLQFTADVGGDASGVTWSAGGSGGGTIDAQGNFTAPTVTQNATAMVTATSVKDPTKSASVTVNIIAPGVLVSCATAGACGAAANAQVAQYTIGVPDGLSAFIQFSTDTSFNLMTWSVAAPAGGGAVPILVAGMKGNTQYHMRAVFQPTGTTASVFTDADHTFTTGAYAATTLPTLTTTTTNGQTPQSGVELLDLIALAAPATGQFHTLVTDLSGNVLWGYSPGSSITAAGTTPNPIKLLPNGHFLIDYSGMPDGQSSV